METAYQRQGLFARLRTVVLIFVFACAAVVLGISSHLASKLLPYDRDFIIFALAVSAATALCLLFAWQRSTPFFESVGLFVFAVLWVAMGGFSVDRIGGVQCIELAGQTLNTGRNKTMSAQRHCEQVKVIMAFSWAEFSTITLMFLVVLALTIRARTHGASSKVWNEEVTDLPWFGTWVGEDRRHYQPTYPMPAYPPPAFSPGPNGTPARIVIQAPPPGETVFLRPEDGYQAPMSYRA